jgi:hypothetical protein
MRPAGGRASRVFYAECMRLFVSLAIGAALAVAGGLAGTGSASGSCVAAIRLHGVLYDRAVFPHALPAERGAVHGGVNPACNDAGPQAAPQPDEPVALRALRGVPARIAVVRPGATREAWLAPGFLLALPSHPLHAVAAHAPASALFGCAAPVLLGGRTRTQPGFSTAGFVVDAGDLDVDVLVRSSTRVRTPRIAGVPYIGQNRRLTIRGCRSKDGRRIAAYSIRAAAPMG